MLEYFRNSRDIGLAAILLTIGAAAFTDWGGPLLALIVGIAASGRIRQRWPALAERRQAGRVAIRVGLIVGGAVGAGQILGTLLLAGLVFLEAPLAAAYQPPAEPAGALQHWLIVIGSTLVLVGLDVGLSTATTFFLTSRRWRPPPSIENIWEKKRSRIGRARWGTGNIHAWPWYFEGDSEIKANSTGAIGDWLRTCTYVRDRKLFLKNDFWQHPLTFEQIKKGDCEDHALWAWRKLVEIGLPAEFVVGYWRQDSGRHAWVVFEERGMQYLLEGTSKRRHPVQPLHEVWSDYRPEYSVDADFKTYRYYGASLKAQLENPSSDDQIVA